jgi:hypothetical protein
MYAALWRALPGPVWVRIVLLLVLAGIVLAVCGLWVFPWVDTTFFVDDSAVGGQ